MGQRPVPGQATERPSSEKKSKGTPLSKKLETNLKTLKDIFHVPESSDVVFREFTCGRPPVKAFVAYIDNLSASRAVFEMVLQPLMLLSSIRNPNKGDPSEYLREALIPNGQVSTKKTIEATVESMVVGDSVVLVDGSDTALAVETKGWEHRTVGEAVSERVVRGPQHGFVEILRTNTALVRSILQTPNLVVENLDVGVRARTKCALLYLKGIVNPKIVQEVRRRVTSIDTAEVLSSGTLGQFIETRHSLFPTIMSTERPDRVAHFIMQGMCAVIVSGDPFALVMPATVLTFIHSPEDRYIRWPYGNLLRAIRYLALFLTVFFPGLYVAVVNYHPEMIPTTLITVIAGSRQNIPFPLSVELLLIYVGFELIREAGIRIPSAIGPTIGIVGALLIGEAAVSASIISPILVIVIAVTGVASFTLPNVEMAMFTRIATLIFILAGSVFGLLGIVSVTYILLSQTLSLSSFGVPYFAPLAPTQSSTHGLMVPEVSRDEKRPAYLKTLDDTRQGSPSRGWDFGKTLEPEKIRDSKGGKGLGKQNSSKTAFKGKQQEPEQPGSDKGSR
ncbi:MAG: spore germination protein [Bacillota bacterium]